MKVLVTGAGGYTGSNLIAGLTDCDVLATDVRFANPEIQDAGTLAVKDASHAGRRQMRCDVRDRDALMRMFLDFRPDAVVHLASIVTPGKKSSRNFEYEVDVTGTQNVLDACVAAGVRRLIVTSSGAAYGYHADNPVPLKESDPVRGNYEFAYSYHKRIVEEMLARHTATKRLPEIVIFRVGTILGQTTNNQITALFKKKALPGVKGSDSPFVFIWDQDVIGAIRRALAVDPAGQFIAPAGIFNLAGDGWMTIDEIAARLKKPVRRWSPLLLKILFGILKPIGVSRYGPEQVRFLQYRPVLDNARLKGVFGYVPQKTSAEAFDFFCKAQIDGTNGTSGTNG